MVDGVNEFLMASMKFLLVFTRYQKRQRIGFIVYKYAVLPFVSYDKSEAFD